MAKTRKQEGARVRKAIKNGPAAHLLPPNNGPGLPSAIFGISALGFFIVIKGIDDTIVDKINPDKEFCWFWFPKPYKL